LNPTTTKGKADTSVFFESPLVESHPLPGGVIQEKLTYGPTHATIHEHRWSGVQGSPTHVYVSLFNLKILLKILAFLSLYLDSLFYQLQAIKNSF